MKTFTLFVAVLPLCGWAEYSDSRTELKREYDCCGRLIKEKFPNGKSIETSYDEKSRVIGISIEEIGSISYKYDDTHLLQISRISPTGQIMYTHSYEYDTTGGLLHEDLVSNLGRISYEKDLDGRWIGMESPYGREECRFNTNGLVISHFLNGETFEYKYDNSDQLLLNETTDQSLTLEYDDSGNLVKKILNEKRSDLEFDRYGNLIEVITDHSKIKYSYDDFNRRVVKKVQKNEKEITETYLYFGDNEIAIYGEDGALEQLRIPGLSFDDNIVLPIVIETKDGIYATIHDYYGNLSKLINTKNREVITIPAMGPFGQNLEGVILPTPWLFASKHYDDEAHLVYFGSRYYDPELRRWISPDPLGTIQHSNVYLYCLGNPLFYFDPDGEFAIPLVSLVWGAGAVLSFPVWGPAALVTATSVAVGWATYEVIQKVKEGKQRDGTPKLNGPQNAQYEDAVREIERKIGKRLNGRDRDRLHDHITGQDYGYHEIIEEGYWLFK